MCKENESLGPPIRQDLTFLISAELDHVAQYKSRDGHETRKWKWIHHGAQNCKEFDELD